MSKILILSGVHGNEYSAVKVGLALKRYYKDNSNVTVVPFCNPEGLLDGVREIPNRTSNDLNRMFFEPDETFKIIKNFIDSHDIIIDIHNSQDCAPFVLLNNDKNLDNLIYWIKTAQVEYASRNSTANTIKKYCLNNGKVGITYEFGNLTECSDEMFDRVLADVKSLIDTFDLAFCECDIEDVYPPHELLSYVSHSYGYVHRLCDVGRIIDIGDKLFSVDNGTEIIEYCATKRLKVIIWNNSFVEDGSEVFQYIEI